MKIAIITGASAGMGKEAVKLISKAYHWLDEIWVIARRAEVLEELKEQVSVPLRVLPLDLTKEEYLLELEVLLEQKNPGVKMLINAAGFGKTGDFMKTSYKDNLGMIDLNCRALTAVTYLCIPYMRKGSRILQFSSSASFAPQMGFAVYAATKAYVLNFSRALRYELMKKEISVTAVCPGPVDTEFFDVAEENGTRMSIKDTFMALPEKVVRKALQDSLNNKEISIYGLPMKSFHVLSKVVPHKAILKGLATAYKY